MKVREVDLLNNKFVSLVDTASTSVPENAIDRIVAAAKDIWLRCPDPILGVVRDAVAAGQREHWDSGQGIGAHGHGRHVCRGGAARQDQLQGADPGKRAAVQGHPAWHILHGW